MEEKDDIIYDIGSAEPETPEPVDNHENPDAAEDPGAAESHDSPENPETPDNATPVDPALQEIGRMVEEMGAATLLDIIKDNRNAAIRTIISEVEASMPRQIPSGASASKVCASIFDLAALA